MGNSRGFWFAPAALGLFLIVLGVLIFSKPQILAYAVALAFVVLGLLLVGLSVIGGRRISYRRIDESEEA